MNMNRYIVLLTAIGLIAATAFLSDSFSVRTEAKKDMLHAKKTDERTMSIDIWSDIACPFCYIGTNQLNKALGDFAHKDGVEVVHHSFQLSPDQPKTTTLNINEMLAEHKGIPLDKAKQMNENVSAYASAEGLPVDMDKIVPVNTFDAHRFTHFAATKGKQEEAVQALYRAYFANGANIADISTLTAIGKEIGLDADEVQRALISDAYTKEVRDDISRASSLGIQGVPFFVIDNKYAISGAQGTEVFSEALEKIWHEAHPLKTIGTGTNSNVCFGGVCDVK